MSGSMPSVGSPIVIDDMNPMDTMQIISRAAPPSSEVSSEGTHTPLKEPFKEDTTHAVHVSHAALKHVTPPPAQQPTQQGGGQQGSQQGAQQDVLNQLNKETSLHNPAIEGFMQQQSMPSPSPVAAGGGAGGAGGGGEEVSVVWSGSYLWKVPYKGNSIPRVRWFQVRVILRLIL